MSNATSSNESNASSEEPQLLLQRIGAGSFATIFVRSGTRTAFKQIHHSNDSDKLHTEYDDLKKIYAFCDTDSLFCIPRPLAFYDPGSDLFLSPTVPSPIGIARRRGASSTFKRSAFKSLEKAAYAMERIFHLPQGLASLIASMFYPEGHRDRPGPKLCRLYFGKTLDAGRPSAFFNSANFPIDVARYEELQGMETLGATTPELAYGMGEMVGRIHWRGGLDARDIEFVLGGDGFDGCNFYVIDFNQMRPWSKTSVEISVLVDAHYLNDPYFPLARPADPLYAEFRRGYLEAYPPDEPARSIAEMFLKAIELRRRDKDLVVTERRHL